MRAQPYSIYIPVVRDIFNIAIPDHWVIYEKYTLVNSFDLRCESGIYYNNQ